MDFIRVYRADLDLLSVTACLPLLDAAERQRAARLSDRHARHEFVTTRALLRLLLSNATGRSADSLEITTGVCGKPILGRTRGVHFNVAHSGGTALIAVSPAEVGIDIERIDQGIDYWGVAASVFSLPEIKMLRDATDARRADVFFSIWTRKEAYLKATGLGLSSDLPAISTASPLGVIEDHSSNSDKHAWHAFDLPAPTHFKAALVTTSSGPNIHVVDIAGIHNGTLCAHEQHPPSPRIALTDDPSRRRGCTSAPRLDNAPARARSFLMEALRLPSGNVNLALNYRCRAGFTLQPIRSLCG